MTCGLDNSDSGRHSSIRINEYGKEPATLSVSCSIFDRVFWSNGLCAVSKVPRSVAARVFAGGVANPFNVNRGAPRALLVSPVSRVKGKCNEGDSRREYYQ